MVASTKNNPKAEPLTVRRRQHGTAHTDRGAGHIGGVVGTARWQGHAEQLEKPSWSPSGNRWSKVARITGQTGKASEGETVQAVFIKKGGRGEMTKAPISLQGLRRRLYVKAKAESTWRFWGLYVHVCKRETLREAYLLAKANDGAPGIDGVTFAAVEAGGVEDFLDQLREELVQRTYRPQRARKVEIPKGGGSGRFFGPLVLSRWAE